MTNNQNFNSENEVDYYVYFDGKQMSGFLATACVVVDRNKSIRPVASSTNTEPSTSGNQFVAVLKSLITTVKCIRENNITGRIVLLNQNKTVINWIMQGRCNDAYAGLFSEVVELLAALQFQCTLFIQPVDPKDNRAKKIVAKVKAPKDQSLGMSRLVFGTPNTSNYAGTAYIQQPQQPSNSSFDEDSIMNESLAELARYSKFNN